MNFMSTFHVSGYWLLLFIALIVIEIITLGLTTIWFAGGALAGLIANVCGLSFWPQMMAFVAVSFLLLFFTRPFAVKYVNKGHVSTNVDELIGMEGVVLEEIDNLKSTGKVQVRGMEWTARSQDQDKRIEKDKIVEICAIEGVKLIVKEKENN